MTAAAVQMGGQAQRQLRKHPELSPQVAQALRWLHHFGLSYPALGTHKVPGSPAYLVRVNRRFRLLCLVAGTQVTVVDVLHHDEVELRATRKITRMRAQGNRAAAV